MEGIVLVEMSSGALHYTNSFSDAFDERHPKTERLNFGALIFALQNFAGSSTRTTENNDGPDATKGLLASGSAEIVMFATSLENMVLTTTPSNKLLVVVFTTPGFDVDIAKWLVRRVAFNYECCDKAEMQIMPRLNQVPSHFRQAFSEAVDETVERQLIRLSENILIPMEGEDELAVETLCDGELFLFFYYSARMGDSGSGGVRGNEAGRKAAGAILSDSREEERCKTARGVNPMHSEISRNCVQNPSTRNKMASTPAIVATQVKRESCNKKKPKKNTRWRSRNAVMDHSEPRKFQRVIEIHCRQRKAALMEPHRTGKAYGIADVLLPFMEVSGLPLFSSDLATLSEYKETQQRPHKLDQLIWENIPSVSSAKAKQRAGTNIIAWRSGPCCIFYPVTAVSMNHDNRPRVRLAVTALFDVLEPLLQAKTKIWYNK